ncbi:MAG TPA: hypothetical protein VGB79_04700 [Allosphingosinicella sp.]|jgi:hypothetical protein
MPTISDTARQIALDLGVDIAAIEAELLSVADAQAHDAPIEGGRTRAQFSGARPIVPPLETAGMFAVQPDATLQPHQLDRNIAEAARAAEAMIAVRREFTDLARALVDAQIAIEEFIRADAVEQMEEEAGAYVLPYEEATADAKASAHASTFYRNAKSQTEQNFSVTPDWALPVVGPLSQDGAKAQVSAARTINNGAGADLAMYRLRSERSNTSASIFAYEASAGAAAHRAFSAGTRRDYARKNVEFRRYRYQITREAALTRYLESLQGGSALNYKPRLHALRSVYEASLRKLLVRVDPIRKGALGLYGKALPVPQPEAGSAADELARWLIQINELLRPTQDTDRQTLVPLAFSSRGGTWREELEVGCSVSVVDPFGLDTPTRLRGIAAERVGTGYQPVGIEVTTPAGLPAWPNALSQEAVTVRLGRATPSEAAANIVPEHAQRLWNLSPWGTWEVRLTHGDLAGISEVILWLFVSY